MTTTTTMPTLTTWNTSDKTTQQSADESAIRALFQQLMSAWNQGNGEAYGAFFTDDADYIAFDGTNTKGRQAIISSHQQLFDKWLKGSRLVGKLTSVRFLGPDVALVHAIGSTILQGHSEPSPERESIQTLVAVCEQGEWRFTAFHNNRVRPIGGNLLSVLVWALSDRLWRLFRLSGTTDYPLPDAQPASSEDR